MKEETKKGLREKGWPEDDISKAEKIMDSSHLMDKSRSHMATNRILFWSILFVMVIGNALVALVLVPFLLALNNFGINIFIVVIGFAFGLLFNFLVWDIEEYLTKKHHLLAALIIPFFAIVNLAFIVKITEAIIDVFGIKGGVEDPLIVVSLYVIAFLLPYLWTLFVKKKIKPYKQ